MVFFNVVKLVLRPIEFYIKRDKNSMVYNTIEIVLAISILKHSWWA